MTRVCLAGQIGFLLLSVTLAVLGNGKFATAALAMSFLFWGIGAGWRSAGKNCSEAGHQNDPHE